MPDPVVAEPGVGTVALPVARPPVIAGVPWPPVAAAGDGAGFGDPPVLDAAPDLPDTSADAGPVAILTVLGEAGAGVAAPPAFPGSWSAPAVPAPLADSLPALVVAGGAARLAGVASLPVLAAPGAAVPGAVPPGELDFGVPEPPEVVARMVGGGVSGISVPPYWPESLPGVAAPTCFAVESPDDDGRGPGVAAGGGVGFGVPALRGGPEPPEVVAPMVGGGVSGISVPPYWPESLPGVAAPACFAAESPDDDGRGPGVAAGGGVGFGVPALRGGSAWLGGMFAGGGVGFGVPGLPERAACAPVDDPLPAVGPEVPAAVSPVVTVVREPGPGVTVLREPGAGVTPLCAPDFGVVALCAPELGLSALPGVAVVALCTPGFGAAVLCPPCPAVVALCAPGFGVVALCAPGPGLVALPGVAVVALGAAGFGVAALCAPGLFAAGPLIEPAPGCPVAPPPWRLPDGVVAFPAVAEPGAALFGRSSVWPVLSGPRLDAGGPGFGRLRLGACRRDSARLRLGVLMRASHAGRRT